MKANFKADNQDSEIEQEFKLKFDPRIEVSDEFHTNSPTYILDKINELEESRQRRSLAKGRKK